MMSNWMSSPCGHACQEMHVPELAGKQKLLVRLHTRKAKIRVMRGAGRSARDEAQYCVSSLDLHPDVIHGCITEHCCSSGVHLNPKTLSSSKGMLLLHVGACISSCRITGCLSGRGGGRCSQEWD